MQLRLAPITPQNVARGLWRERTFLGALTFGAGPSLALLMLLCGADAAEVAAVLPAILTISLVFVAGVMAAAVAGGWGIEQAAKQVKLLRPLMHLAPRDLERPSSLKQDGRSHRPPTDSRPPKQ
ncbi:hypothetical protein WCE41_01890 [Luteimonas sp. MJ246]|uniref:hypothetical protein n=1 Tax=Luteimonas sp. MJ174 TaxID=3129237 RepID=UPI0031BB59D3